MKIALQLIGVSKDIPGGIAPLDLSIYAGEVLGLLGPDGSGKSTLLGLIAGEVEPTEGQVLRMEAPILLDEPEAPPLELRPHLQRLTRVDGQAVVLATRRLALAHGLCDRILLLDQGRIRAIRPAADLAELLDQECYRITVAGHLPAHIASWLDGFAIRPLASGNTALQGCLPDQAALHGLLNRIRDLGLPLVEVVRVEPDLSPLYQVD